MGPRQGDKWMTGIFGSQGKIGFEELLEIFWKWSERHEKIWPLGQATKLTDIMNSLNKMDYWLNEHQNLH